MCLCLILLGIKHLFLQATHLTMLILISPQDLNYLGHIGGALKPGPVDASVILQCLVLELGLTTCQPCALTPALFLSDLLGKSLNLFELLFTCKIGLRQIILLVFYSHPLPLPSLSLLLTFPPWLGRQFQLWPARHYTSIHSVSRSDCSVLQGLCLFGCGACTWAAPGSVLGGCSWQCSGIGVYIWALGIQGLHSSH